jgi:predicted nucleic acid-binding protein
MIVYLDASALVKRYVAEAGSPEVAALLLRAEAVGTALISRAEVAAALAKARRLKLLPPAEAAAAMQVLSADWEDLVRIQLTEALVARAASLAWEDGLRGYDAVHLASAVLWQEILGESVTVATFDRQLWEAARRAGLIAWPESSP